MKAANAKKYLKQSTASTAAGQTRPATQPASKKKPFVSKEDELLMDEMLESGQAEGPGSSDESDTEYTEQELRDEGYVWDAPGTTPKKTTKQKRK